MSNIGTRKEQRGNKVYHFQVFWNDKLDKEILCLIKVEDA